MVTTSKDLSHFDFKIAMTIADAKLAKECKHSPKPYINFERKFEIDNLKPIAL